MLNPIFDLGDRVKLEPRLTEFRGALGQYGSENEALVHNGQVGVIVGAVEFLVVRWPDGTEQTCHPNTILKAE